MVKLVDMAYSKAELKERNSPTKVCSYPGDSEKYPYGLTVSLSDEQLTKLGITLPKVGSTVTLTAQCKVVSTSSNERANGEANQRLELQMQKIAVESGVASALEAVNAALDETKDG